MELICVEAHLFIYFYFLFISLYNFLGQKEFNVLSYKYNSVV